MNYVYKLSKRSLRRLEGVHPTLVAIAVDSIVYSPFDFGIPQHGGKRTASEQNLLFKEGLSQRDGYEKKSYHQTGMAFDIFGYVEGKATWDADILEEIARHIQKTAKEKYNVELIWGGDWDNDGIRVDKDGNEFFFDVPHFQAELKEL